jgi:nucleoside-diphosphate-sugar epimerase
VRVLVLGGTVFVGRHIVEAALARGDEVTIFNRGRTGLELFPEVERLVGDRDGELDALRGREWDIVVDASGYVPRVVRQSAELLAGAVGRYCFVSSMSVYAEIASPLTEESPVATLDDAASEDVSKYYGELKVACEGVVEEIYRERALLVRPGKVSGPHDPTGGFTYWPVRVARGGEVLTPGPPEHFVQYIDARDLGVWILNAAATETSGAFHVIAPPLPFSHLLEACVAESRVPVELAWVDPDFLLGAGVSPWTELPLWLAAVDFENVDTTKARAAGLVTRPLAETVRDTLAWASSLDGDPASQEDGRYVVRTLTPEREAELLAAWHAR